MRKKERVKRYKVTQDGEPFGEFTTIQSIADGVGCHHQLLYKSRREMGDNKFRFKGITYQIIDKLDLV